MDTDNTPLDMSGQREALSSHTLSVEAASALFSAGGVPRSPRTIIRYCAHNHLDCMKVVTERNEKYLVSESSARARIEELKQIVGSSHVELGHDTTRHDGTERDMSGHDETRRDATHRDQQKMQERIGQLEQEVERLKDEKRDLEITNRVKDHVLKKAEGELARSQGLLMRVNRAVGELVTALRLKAPEHDTSPIIQYLDAPAGPRQGETFTDSLGEQM